MKKYYSSLILAIFVIGAGTLVFFFGVKNGSSIRGTNDNVNLTPEVQANGQELEKKQPPLQPPSNPSKETTQKEEVADPYQVPSEWVLFNGDLLGFTLQIPSTWAKSSAQFPYSRPEDPIEPKQYKLLNRPIENLMSDFTDEDFILDIKKFRKQNKTFDQIIEQDSEMFNVQLLSEFAVDNHAAKTYQRERKPEYGSELSLSQITYIEDFDGVYSFDFGYENLEKFKKNFHDTIQIMLHSFKKN